MISNPIAHPKPLFIPRRGMNPIAARHHNLRYVYCPVEEATEVCEWELGLTFLTRVQFSKAQSIRPCIGRSKVFPRLVNSYSTRGGNSGNASRRVNPLCSRFFKVNASIRREIRGIAFSSSENRPRPPGNFASESISKMLHLSPIVLRSSRTAAGLRPSDSAAGSFRARRAEELPCWSVVTEHTLTSRCTEVCRHTRSVKRDVARGPRIRARIRKLTSLLSEVEQPPLSGYSMLLICNTSPYQRGPWLP